VFASVATADSCDPSNVAMIGLLGVVDEAVEGVVLVAVTAEV